MESQQCMDAVTTEHGSLDFIMLGQNKQTIINNGNNKTTINNKKAWGQEYYGY